MTAARLVQSARSLRAIEWPTLALALGCYAVWGAGTTWVAEASVALGMILTIIATTLHSSLTHEALHGHPFRSRLLNTVLVFPALSVVVPYLRFRDTHLAHHRDAIITDPYDDPESNYLDPVVWNALPRPVQVLLRFNNTLAGRLSVGPILGQIAFMRQDLRAARAGDRRVLLGWLLHVPALGVVLWWMLTTASLPLWAWAICVYMSLSILKIRTFLEHQAHDRARGRTVIIEDRGLLAFLFLNNNLHVVHHMHAAVPWYRLPVLYHANKDRYLGRNEGYRYSSYGEVFRRYFWRRKDPVAHPLWPSR